MKLSDNWVTGNSDLLVTLILDFILFHNLVTGGYIGYADMTTIPAFIGSPDLPGILASLSGISYFPPIFQVPLDAGLTVVQVLYSLVFGTYSLNLLYYSWLVFYSLGLVFLLRNLTQNKGLIILGTAVGLVNPGVLNVIRDSPLTLYIGPIPWFIAFYYRYRILRRSRLNLLLSLLPLTILSIYGPGIPALLLSLISVEMFAFLRQGQVRDKIVSSLKSVALVLFFFTVFHLNVLYLVLTGGPQLDTYREAENYLVTNYGIPSFNLIQQLEFNVLSNKFNYYYISLLSWASTTFSQLIAVLLLIYGLISIVLLLRSKNFFPLIFFSLSVALVSYAQNYLDLYQTITHTFPIFAGVDPSEYNPLMGVFLAMATTSFKTQVKPMVFRLIHYLPLVLIIFLTLLSGVVMEANLAVVWNHVNLPQSVEQGYQTLYAGIQGETVISVPPIDQFYFPFYTYNGTVYGLRNPEPCVPPDFPLLAYPKSAVVIDSLPSVANLENPYVELYYMLFIGNTTGFQYYSTILNVQRIFWIGPSVNFNKLYTPYYVANLTMLENRTGFHVIADYGDFAILGSNNDPTYKLLIRGPLVEIYPLRNVTSVVTPVGYGTQVIVNGYSVRDYGGVVEVVSSHPLRPFTLTSNYVIFNLITDSAIIVFYLVLLVSLFKVVWSRSSVRESKALSSDP